MNRLVHTSLLLALVCSVAAPPRAAAAPLQQTVTPPDPRVAQSLDDLTPEGRVGQLFVVTFDGRTTDESTPIYELISEYHVGGVVLSAADNNFADTDSFAASALELTTNLQSIAAGIPPNAATPTAFSRAFIPLFVATAYPDARLGNTALLPGRSGLTPLPDPMTLGATWTPIHAQVAGRVTGQELSALGINMLLGPTLDVIESPQPGSSADLGARAFGGDPYWVGKMGRAFIQGVHEGSLNRIAVVSQHFPGYGASDRALDEPQLPTVSKTLDELQAIDLAPFFDVAQVGAPDSTDALLVSHIRYRGLQGNIRDTTRPISLDQQALGDLLSLPELAAWRTNGGVTVSDALGVRAVRRFYDPTERTFNAYAIARDAFLAGNDVLYLGQFAGAEADPNARIKDVLAQFVQKYKEDPAFAQRVDAAVMRILSLKLRLYGDFTWGAVQPEVPLNALGTGSLEALAATTAGATLVSPAPAELANRLPAPPARNHQIVFFTDTRMVKQCSACLARPSIPVDALQNAILKLYGSAGTGEVASVNLSSFSFVDLANFLSNQPPATPTPTPEPSPTPEGATPEPTPTPAPPDVAEALDEADWIVFVMLDVKASVAESNAVSRLLAERPALLQDKRVIVFALDAPYYLDATDVAQLTAYYALYSRSSAAIEVAARILFQEITPSGASPVSVDSVGYKLIDATQPNPNQVIALTYEIQPKEGAAPTLTPVDPSLTPAPPSVAVGDVLTLRTGVILDSNGRPVPDNTVVRFFVTYPEVIIPAQFAEAGTVDGVASTSFVLDRAGILELSVSSEPALTSIKLQFNLSGTPVPPTIIEPPTATPTNSPPPTAPPTQTPTPGVTPTPTPSEPPSPPPVTWIDLLMTILTLGVMGGIVWRVTNSRAEAVSDGVKLILIIAIGALVGYNYYALRLPGAALMSELGFWAVPLMVWSGGLIGFGVGWWWLRRGARAK